MFIHEILWNVFLTINFHSWSPYIHAIMSVIMTPTSSCGTRIIRIKETFYREGAAQKPRQRHFQSTIPIHVLPPQFSGRVAVVFCVILRSLIISWASLLKHSAYFQTFEHLDSETASPGNLYFDNRRWLTWNSIQDWPDSNLITWWEGFQAATDKAGPYAGCFILHTGSTQLRSLPNAHPHVYPSYPIHSRLILTQRINPFPIHIAYFIHNTSPKCHPHFRLRA